MGRGSYTAADWAELRQSHNLDNRQMVENIYTSRRASQKYLCRDISYRLSCDPDDNSEATPIIVGFDVTASMNYLAKELATNGMHNIITALLTREIVSSPQILCSAIGDCKSDEYPLQVTQFEADIRIIEQLLDLHIEGGGGGNNGESYNLLWYFAANHTIHDHYKKRQKKGYIFTIGDDKCHSGLTKTEINRVFSSEYPYSISNRELIAAACEKYHIFHIHIEKNDKADDEIFRYWYELMPGCCAPIDIKSVNCLAELITAIILIYEGRNVNEALNSISPKKAECIARSIAAIKPPTNENIISF